MEYLLMICTAVLLLCIVYLIIVGFLLVKKGVFHHPLGLNESAFVDKVTDVEYPGTKEWISHMVNDGILQELYITNNDGLKLHAYYASCPNASRTVVVTHGYSGCALQMMPYARMWLEKLHCNILVHDMPHHGRSEGSRTQMGWYEKNSLLLWINKAKELFPHTDIYLQGLSMGSATSLMVLGLDIPSEVKGVVSDCAFSSAWDLFCFELGKNFKYLPKLPSLYAADLICQLRCGWSFRDASAYNVVKRTSIPILFIHGDADNRVPVSHGLKLYDAKKNGDAFLWVTKDAGHGCSLIMYADEYCKRVADFLSAIQNTVSANMKS